MPSPAVFCANEVRRIRSGNRDTAESGMNSWTIHQLCLQSLMERLGDRMLQLIQAVVHFLNRPLGNFPG
jgi:hypothetical protein